MPMPTTTTNRIVVSLPASPTGERCADCHAPSYFVPGYLFTNDKTGAKCFTVARRTEHEASCADGWEFEPLPS
jgi:hypothetical protein